MTLNKLKMTGLYQKVYLWNSKRGFWKVLIISILDQNSLTVLVDPSYISTVWNAILMRLRTFTSFDMINQALRMIVYFNEKSTKRNRLEQLWETSWRVRITHQKWQCWYENPMTNNILKTWILRNNFWIAELRFYWPKVRDVRLC